MMEAAAVALVMELRAVEVERREVVGVVAPYGETSYLTRDPSGERLKRGAFSKSIRQRETRIPLYRNHDHSRVLGYSRHFEDGDDGLVGTFAVNDGDDGDAFLTDLRNGYYAGLSVGYHALTANRGRDGVREVAEAKLVEVSAVGLPAYEGAGLLAVREAQNLDELLAPFANRPPVNLAPLPPIGYRPRR
jgi:uncharacterized protein